MQNTLTSARARMREAYACLPEDYFAGKDASTFRFNNITRLAEAASTHEEPIGPRLYADAEAAPVSLYFGVPWCEKICSFCNFAYSTSQSNDVHKSYIKNLHAEYKLFKRLAGNQLKVASLYFGGGTPTILAAETLSDYLASTIAMVPLATNPSITCEFSTSTIDREKLTVLKEVGVTRISTGVQSLDDTIRTRANLVGSGEDALSSIMMAREYYNNFNIDLIYGHPHQTDEDWYRTVKTIAGLDFPSITLYRLEIKTRTTFKKIYIREEDVFSDELQARLHYFIAREILEEHGYTESPLGWWIKKNTLLGESSWQTHLHSWRRAMPYYGFGQGAFSLASGVYYENHSVLAQWDTAIKQEQLPIGNSRSIAPWAQDLNQLMRLIRVSRRFDLQAVIEGSALVVHSGTLGDFFSEQQKIGLFQQEENLLVLTEAGESLVHWIFDDMIRRLLKVESEKTLLNVGILEDA